MSRVPNAVAFVFFIGIAVTLTNTLTAPAGGHLIVLIAGLVTTVLVALVVAAAMWIRTKIRDSKRGD